MGVTAHYLRRVPDPTPPHAEHLELCTSLIGFYHIPGSHDGISLARTLYKVLDRVGILRKVCVQKCNQHYSRSMGLDISSDM